MQQNTSSRKQKKDDQTEIHQPAGEEAIVVPVVERTAQPKQSIVEKRIVAIAGNRGGTGKTTTAVTLYEWYLVNGINVFSYDYESDNKESSCFAHFVKDAARYPLHYERDALDQMLRDLETKDEAIILADFGAGSQRETIQFYKDYYEMLIDHNVRMTLVGVLDSDVGALKGILDWADNLQSFTKMDWMIVLNGKGCHG